MNKVFSNLVAASCLLFCGLPSELSFAVEPSLPSKDESIWPTASKECKPGVIWWIPGSAMTEQDITFNLEQLSEAGFGGMSMVPIYGVKGAEDRFLDYLSPAWNEHFEFVVSEAERLGLWVDLTPGTGWKIGGPAVSKDMGERSAQLVDGKLIVKHNGSKVKRAAPGGSGFSIDPYSQRALGKFLQHFTERIELGKNRTPRAFYHDSFEYTGNWTDRLPEVFATQHGYDLANYVAELFGESKDKQKSARIRRDYRQTLDSLHYDFVKDLGDWAHRNGSRLREQAHGSPCNLIDLYALADIPETEVFGANRFDVRGLRREDAFVRHEDDSAPMVNRLASSASHLSGGKLVSSESFTWLREHFNASLAEIKPEVDSLFLTGVNHLFYHGNCFSPQDDPWPGWLFYASTEMNSRNAIWRDVPQLNQYIMRCQSVLQAGEADNDILLYWPIDDVYQDVEGNPHVFLKVHNHEAWITETACGKLAQRFVDQGYLFDFVSDRFIKQAKVGKGIIKIGESNYRALVVPPCKTMPLETLSTLLQWSRAGIPICFCDGGPKDVPGFGDLKHRRSEFAKLASQIQSSEVADVKLDDLSSWLDSNEILRESMTDRSLGLIRRVDAQGHYYFITNLSAKDVDDWVSISRPFRQALRLDPMTGSVGQLPTDGQDIRLQLASGQSCIVRLQKERKALPRIADWPIWSAADQPEHLKNNWQVTFVAGGPELPASFETKQLGSWTKSSDAAERFAGTAAYETTFNLPSAMDGIRLDLGDVRESARIYVDGKHIHTLFAHPFHCDIAGLSPGDHALRIEVTNLSANRIRDLDKRNVPWKKFYDINFVNLSYKQFDASTWPVRPSGLLGPVTIQSLEKQTSPRGSNNKL